MKRGLIIAGEASADLYASFIAKKLKEKHLDLKITAIGGSKTESTKTSLLFNYKDVAVVGAFEVLAHLRKILNAIKDTVKWIRDNEPDFIIFIDLPDFNFRVIKKIKSFYRGKIIYFISPQVWAWRQKRVEFIKKYVDRMIVILPFEKDFYKKRGLEVDYLGHPLMEIVKPTMSKEQFREKFGFNKDARIISVFLGSRLKEIEKHKKVIKEFIEKLKIKYADLEFALVSPNSDITRMLEQYFSMKRVKIIEGYNYDAINNSFIVISKSGTTTLETAILEKPAIVFYNVSKISFLLAKLLINVKYIALPNIILDELVYPEFIQQDFNNNNLLTAFERYMDDTDLYVETVEKLKRLKEILGGENYFDLLTERISGMVYG